MTQNCEIKSDKIQLVHNFSLRMNLKVKFWFYV